MKWNSTILRGLGFVIAVVWCSSTTVLAGPHRWQLSEVFSTADGSVQFIELVAIERTPNESGSGGQHLSSEAQATTVPLDLPVPTSRKFYLIGTDDFAALPGAPQPDHIIPSGGVPFFSTTGDSVSYGQSSVWSLGIVPTDGINSLNESGFVRTNSPTNYAGASGSISVRGVQYGDVDSDGNVDLHDFAVFAGCLTGPGVTVAGPPCNLFDADSDSEIDTGDYAAFQFAFSDSCVGEEVFCEGFCADLESDPDHCGSCGEGCPALPASTCGTTGTCLGGECEHWPFGAVCAERVCVGSTEFFEDVCNGAGVCLDGGSQSCDPYLCNGDGTECAFSCADDSGCVVEFFCSAPFCNPKQQSGASCGGDNECISDVCSGGFCQ